MNKSSQVIRFFICGSALRGQPDHKNLLSAQFIGAARTQPYYRLHAAGNGWHPAIYQVENNGISIPGPPNMYPAEVQLDTGERLTAMLYPQELIEKYNWPDISNYGGWAAYKSSVQAVSV
ncbi:MAG: hypothetical protein RLZZ148_99 [Cyanobacteriota bacterium]